ncbi:MAG: hypothetical protein EB059_10815 [Alphaproteobacteria bacterium]|nr:hypothetical protein [Alphaproteobacteria bacterium]
MTNLDLLDKYCDTCLDFIHPSIFREIEGRGLTTLINRLNTLDPKEAKAIIRARLASKGQYVGDPEIERIASIVDWLQILRYRLNQLNMASAHDVKKIAAEMLEHSQLLLDFYK